MIKETKYAIFEYEQQDEDLINIVSLYLDKNAKKIYNFFELKYDGQKVRFNIVPAKEKYDKIYKKHHGLNKEYCVPNWNIGFSKENEIFMVSFNDYKNVKSHKKDGLLYYKKTVIHEFVHFVNNLFNKANKCGETEKFLSEGIACYLSKQKLYKNLILISGVDKILDKNSFVSYNEYCLLTKFLVENYDKNLVFELFKSNRQAKEFLKTELYNRVKQEYQSFKNQI